MKAFHPDRERNETERERKTEIMKRITEAYEKDDLYELLKLKIELIGSDSEALNLADDQLKYYNKILKEQVNELESANYSLEIAADDAFPNFHNIFTVPSVYFEKMFKSELNASKKNVKNITKDIELLGFKDNVRSFLREYELQEEEDDFDVDFSFFR